MRIVPSSRPLPTRTAPRSAAAARRLRKDSELSATILRMIALNSLAAFTQDVGRTGGVASVAPIRERARAPEAERVAERRLDEAPTAAMLANPRRGQLLDLRV